MINYLTMFFQKTYDLMATICVPGFNISIISVLFGSVAALVSISLLKMIFGLGNTAVSGGSSYIFRQRGGNNKDIKISEERKQDKTVHNNYNHNKSGNYNKSSNYRRKSND